MHMGHVATLSFSIIAACGRPTAPPETRPEVANERSLASAHVSPPPQALADAAAPFGLAFVPSDRTWAPLDEKRTRFQWTARPPSGDHELLYSFWRPKLEDVERRFLVNLVTAAAANLAAGSPCPAIDQPREVVEAVGFDRVITVCFTPNEAYAHGFGHGVMHGIVRRGALTIAVVLANDARAVVPTAKSIGAIPLPSS